MLRKPVAASEPVRVSLDELEREICELAAHIAAATCRWLLLVAEFDERRGWAEWGVKSCAQWLSWRCSIGPNAGREHVRVARRLGELPLVREAFASGELSYCKVRAITRVATAEIEASLVEIARHATGAQLEKLVRGYQGALATTLDAAQRAHELRHLDWSWEEDGSLRLEARLPADEGALLLAALNAAAESVPTAPVEDCTQTPAMVRVGAAGGTTVGGANADALVSLARSGLAGGTASRIGGDPCELVVHVDVETLAGDEVKACGEIAGGPGLAPETLRRLGCDAAVVRIIERDGRPLSVGRRRRTIPAALRRALRSRDEGCRFPGCTHRRFLHAHHIHHWARGGPTTLENLVHLCSYHHRLVHEGGYGVERAGSRSVRFRRPDGRMIPPTVPGARAVGPRLEHQQFARRLAIDERTCLARSAGDRIDYGIAVEGLLARALAAT
jgi:Domain of unknown function (DUF222)/HNH endonuclease